MKVLVKRILIYHSKNFHLHLTGKLIRSGISLALTKLNFIAIYFDSIRISKQSGVLKIEKEFVPPVEHGGKCTYEGYGLKIVSDGDSTTIVETQHDKFLKK